MSRDRGSSGNFSGSQLQQELWYVGCTASRHERVVAEYLRGRSIEHFLPLYRTVRRWNNGRHCLELPLFSGYIFVRIALCRRLQVLEAPGLARLVSFGGLPVPISAAEIDALRTVVDSGLNIEPYAYLTRGRRVEIVRGPLQGTTGLLLRRRGDCRVVLSVDLIMRSMTVEVDLADVIPVRGIHEASLGPVPALRVLTKANS